jgi:3-hydroxyisobutyrate dehydrogenase
MSFERKTIGFIGLGVMGKSMAGHLLSAGHRLIVYTRSPDKAKPLLDRGAEWAESPAILAPRCDVIITMVGFPPMWRKFTWATGGSWRTPAQGPSLSI